jgi:hypothetical protein
MGCSLTACRSVASTAEGALDAGTDTSACARVVAMTDGETCPVVPASGIVCDLTDIASGWCSAADCPPRSGCCSYTFRPGETCFSVCGDCAGVPGDEACVAEGTCATDSDCQGSLPHICKNCPLSPDGQASQGCAHWMCNAGRCEVGYCAPGLSCQAGRGCPSYYLPPVNRTCTTAADCALVDHLQSCCLVVKTAVRVDKVDHFGAVERQCASIQNPGSFPCGCIPSLVNEEGLSPGPGQSFEAACVAATCKAVVTGQLRCGAGTCDAGQSCCTSAGDGGYCVYSCAASCPVNDAGDVACRSQ